MEESSSSSPEDEELLQGERLIDFSVPPLDQDFEPIDASYLAVPSPVARRQAPPADSSNQTDSRDTIARDAAISAVPDEIHLSHEFPLNTADVQLQGVAGSDQTGFAREVPILSENENDNKNTYQPERTISKQIDLPNPSLGVAKLRGTNEHPSIQSIQRIGPSRIFYEQAQENREQVLLCIVIGLRDYGGRFVKGTNYREEPYPTYFELCKRRSVRVRAHRPNKDALEGEVTRRFGLLGLERTRAARAPFRKIDEAVQWLNSQPITDPSDIDFFIREISIFHQHVLGEVQKNRANASRPKKPPPTERAEKKDLCRLETRWAAIRASRQWYSQTLLPHQCRALTETPSHRSQETHVLEGNVLNVSLALAECKQIETQLQAEVHALQQQERVFLA